MEDLRSDNEVTMVEAYSKVLYMVNDLKYMTKPTNIPAINQDTDFLDKWLGIIRRCYLSDLCM
jgi:hypothetical protein